MGEFELIARYFEPLSRGRPSSYLVLGPGDDCAIQRVDPGAELVFSVDTLVAGVHFPASYDPENLGWRSLAVAASDLAAMGADPVCFTLALTLPDIDEAWLTGFARGLSRAADRFGLLLAGGDTTRGPLTLSLQVHGTVPSGTAIRRSGACPGDLVCVSGTLGDAGEALRWLDVNHPGPDEAFVLARYHRPQPRLELGRALRGYASAAIDISDGLLADLGHILDASGVGARLELEQVPLSDALMRLAGESAAMRAVVAGDDYELCVTMAPETWQSLPQACRNQLTVVGRITEESGLRLFSHGAELHQAARGYDHFGATE